jgi:carbonic anhydrase
MSDASDTFFTSVGCMDGRVQEPIAEFGKKRYGVKFPDTITEAGLVGKYAEVGNDSDLGRAIKFKVVDVSVGKHHSKGIIIHGHQKCAGNPIDDETHKKQVLKSVQLMKELNPNVEVLPVFVNLVDGNWEVEEL